MLLSVVLCENEKQIKINVRNYMHTILYGAWLLCVLHVLVVKSHLFLTKYSPSHY